MAKLPKEVKEALTQRIEAAKKLLPESGVTSLYRQRYPQLCDNAHLSRVSSVLTLRTFDEDITKRIERIAEVTALNVPTAK